MLHKPCMPGPFAVVSKKAYDFVGVMTKNMRITKILILA